VAEKAEKRPDFVAPSERAKSHIVGQIVRLVLRSHLKANPKNRYLFESRRCTPFTPRRVQQIVQGYRDRAGIAQHVHPHLFRHQMLTFLTSHGLSDAQIQLISGHESQKSLEVYQHLSLETVEVAYQEVMKSVGV
jgi:site-specific recombinase XerD